MFGLGFGEMILLGAIALIAIGPKQLPEVARTLGKFMNELKRATGDFSKSFTDISDTTRAPFNDAKKQMQDVFTGVTSTYQPPVHTPEQETAAAMAMSHAASTEGFEPNPQGSLFIPTDLSQDAHVPHENSTSFYEEQLEFHMTSFEEANGHEKPDTDV